MASGKQWHSLVQEKPFDPRRRIVDAHHHLWRENEGPHPGPPYLHDHLLADIAKHNVVGTVYIESGVGYRDEGPEDLRAVGETEFALAQAHLSANTHSPIRGIVAGADLRLGEKLGDVLDAHEVAGHGLFRGIRQRHDREGKDAGYDFLVDPMVIPGLRQLGGHGFSFDAFAIFSRLNELATLARSVPETNFILLHLGMPLTSGAFGPREDVMRIWRSGMIEVAKCQNVVLKIGGIGMDSLYGTNWSKRPLPPTSDEAAAWWCDDLRFCIDSFGPSRSMFESNFPVDGEGMGYTVLWNTFQKIAAAYSDEEQDAMFSGTAIGTYRLEGLRKD
jgi:L-fuconolactonase